jgi:hypothetical protein
MINQTSWKPSVVVGTILMFMGIIPFIIWMVDMIGVIDSELGHWATILVSAALFGFGTLLAKGKGDSIAQVILNMMPEKK